MVWSFITKATQSLKKFYAPTFATLHDWSIPITDTGRINYPSSFEERSTIGTNFIKQLNSFPAGKSPLQPFLVANKTDVGKMAALLSDAITNKDSANVASKAAENSTEQRNLLWKDPSTHIHQIADFLKSVYPDNPAHPWRLGICGR